MSFETIEKDEMKNPVKNPRRSKGKNFVVILGSYHNSDEEYYQQSNED